MAPSILTKLLSVLVALAPPADPPDIRPVSSELSVEIGMPAYLTFSRAAPDAGARSVQVSSSRPDVLEVRGPLSFLEGHEHAFLELIPRGEGEAEVRVAGAGDEGVTASCRVFVRPASRDPVVRLLSPPDGAVLWGEVVVAARARGDIRSLELRIDGEGHTLTESGTLLVHLDADRYRGVHEIEVVGTHRSGRSGKARARVQFAGPEPGDATRSWTREAESLTGARAVATISPAEPVIQDLPDVSGGQIASLYAPQQLLQLNVDVPQPGYYQAVIEARGDVYLTHPAMAVIVDDELYKPAGTCPVVSSARFGRHFVGAPFLVPAGEHRISFIFYNDAVDPQTRLDRNCHVDRVEVRHVGDSRPDVIPPEAVLTFPPDGYEVSGQVDVYGLSRDDTDVASTELRVDGEIVARGRGRFLLHRLGGGDLEPGDHVLELVSVDRAGNRGESKPIRVTRLPYSGNGAPSAGFLARHGSSPTVQASPAPAAPGQQAFGLYGGNVSVRFEVTALTAGEFEVRLLARGDSFLGPPRARVVVTGGGEELSRIELEVPGRSFSPSTPGRITLRQGSNRVEISLANDLFDGPGRDRNLHVAGMELWRLGVDTSPPWVQIAHPRDGATLVQDELVVVRASDDSRVRLVELLVDGEPISRSGTGGVTGLWLHRRAVAPGPHEIQVRVEDQFGNIQVSETRRIAVTRAPVGAALSDSTGAGMSDTAHGIRLLQRLGLGLRRESLARLLLVGRDAWLSEQLGARAADDRLADFLDRELMRDNIFDTGRLRQAVIARMLATRQPVRERLTRFFDNHFSTWVGKTSVIHEWIENRTFRELALESFGWLLLGSATSPAMLTYLDNLQNRRGRPNENYARELLELHTLGVDGGYGQSDVEEVARVFTGWTATLGHPLYEWATFEPHHDHGPKEALGHRFGGDASAEPRALLGVLAAHPSTSRFVARKLAAVLVADDPPERLVEAAAERFRVGGGDVRSTILAIVDSAEFRSLGSTKTKDPVELVLGLARQGLMGFDVAALDQALTRMGQDLFGCVTPDGWPEEGDEWLNAATLLQRWNFAELVAERVRLERLIGPFSQERAVDSVIDDLAMSLLGNPLSPSSRQAVRESFPGPSIVGEDALRSLTALVLQMPEAQTH